MAYYEAKNTKLVWLYHLSGVIHCDNGFFTTMQVKAFKLYTVQMKQINKEYILIYYNYLTFCFLFQFIQVNESDLLTYFNVLYCTICH